jgi:hypothetical protein
LRIYDLFEVILKTGINCAFANQDLGGLHLPGGLCQGSPSSVRESRLKPIACASPQGFHAMSRWLQPREIGNQKPQFVTVQGI